MTDVHQGNCGQHDAKPVIVDFEIPFRDGYQRETVRQIVAEGIPAPAETEEHQKVADACSPEERIKIAKSAITRWNLMEQIERAKIRTYAVKEEMAIRGIKIEKIDDFAKYVADVKYNCSLFL